MASTPAPSRRSDRNAFASRAVLRRSALRVNSSLLALAFAAALISLPLIAPSALRAQSASPHITSITPDTGKAEDTITITGQNLGKSNVAAVFLSDAKLDHKAVVVDQESTKIVIKVPDNLKPGDYNISVQEGGAIYIQPVIFTVKT
jgi:methionine-rich copper-binding protein CopC